jgi:hypothetical protein
MATINFRCYPNVNDLENEPTLPAATGKRRVFATVKFGENFGLQRGIAAAFRNPKNPATHDAGPAFCGRLAASRDAKAGRPHCLRRKSAG